MDMNEIYMLFMVLEKSHAQGTSFLNIRSAAIDRLNEINAELDPAAKAEPVAEPEPEKEPEDA